MRLAVYHLNVLKQADLVIDERKGQNIYYSLNTSVFDEVIKWCLDLKEAVRGEEK
ncbi:hypothetical protein KKC1_09650 [Calderihabitans maritimus]|uniref:ArsR family transcriptional regulator n=1 Tax=Calderihabitans maritimus TaxID=1246530 RepID=A0A1Z5HR64_9FIRM|nr:helix-turn-helix transcriptional regulator [Calderihabitans maritimus]GAW91805.1 hypothetical protein KKC1_09650 [Calderihabitans maritimus]